MKDNEKDSKKNNLDLKFEICVYNKYKDEKDNKRSDKRNDKRSDKIGSDVAIKFEVYEIENDKEIVEKI